jgi:hypothetical protein
VAPLERKLMAILPMRFLTKANIVADVGDVFANAMSNFRVLCADIPRLSSFNEIPAPSLTAFEPH